MKGNFVLTNNKAEKQHNSINARLTYFIHVNTYIILHRI